MYLIAAQNLSATGVSLDWKSRLAGMTSLSTANPYVIISTGGGKKTERENQFANKEWNDRENSFDKNLSPRFFKVYEMTTQFPEDWKLEIKIMDKATFSAADQLIGSTVIDLENRLHSNLLFINKIAMKWHGKRIEDEYKKLKKDKSKKGRAKASAKNNELK